MDIEASSTPASAGGGGAASASSSASSSSFAAPKSVAKVGRVLADPTHVIDESAMRAALELNASLLGEWHSLVARHRRSKEIPATDAERMALLEKVLMQRLGFLGRLADCSRTLVATAHGGITKIPKQTAQVLDPATLSPSLCRLIWGGEGKVEEEEIAAASASLAALNPLPLSVTVPEIIKAQGEAQAAAAANSAAAAAGGAASDAGVAVSSSASGMALEEEGQGQQGEVDTSAAAAAAPGPVDDL